MLRLQKNFFAEETFVNFDCPPGGNPIKKSSPLKDKN